MCVGRGEERRGGEGRGADVCEAPRSCGKRAFLEPVGVLQARRFLCQLCCACVPRMHVSTCIDAWPWPGADGVFKKKTARKKWGRQPQSKGEGKVGRALGDHVTVFPSPHTFTCIYALACCRVADRVPFLFFYEHRKAFFFCWSV